MNELIALLGVAVCEPEPTCGWQARLSCPSGSHPCLWNACVSALPSLPLCLSIYPQLVSRYHILRNCPVTVESIWEAVGSISRYVAFNCVHSLPCSVRRASIRISSARVTEQAMGSRAPGYPLTPLVEIRLMLSVYESFHQTVKYVRQRNHILQDLTRLEI